MAGRGLYLRTKTLDYCLGQRRYTPPATVYLALFTVAPNGECNGTEVSGGNYERVAMVNAANNWPDAAVGGTTKTNANAVHFLPTTALLGPVVAYGLFGSPTHDDLLYWNDMPSPETFGIGEAPTFKPGTLIFVES